MRITFWPKWIVSAAEVKFLWRNLQNKLLNTSLSIPTQEIAVNHGKVKNNKP